MKNRLSQRPRYVYTLTALLIALTTQTALADARSEGEKGIQEYYKGNLIEAMELLQKSAEGGYTPAQTTLARILDAAEYNDDAFRWFQRAANQKDPDGLFGLAEMFIKGEGTEKDPRRAGQLMQEAANLGHVVAMRVYASALEHGNLGLRLQPAEAAAWYLRAAELGDKLSMERIKTAHANGELGLAKDADSAAEWQKRIDQE